MADSPDVETLRAQVADLQQQLADLKRRLPAKNGNADDSSAWFSVTQAGQIWNLHPSSVRRIAHKRFKQFTPGGKNYLPRDYVLAGPPHKAKKQVQKKA